MDTLSVEAGIKIQTEQLKEWKSVLKKSVYKDLKLWATSKNHEANDGFGICRGSDLDNYVNNYNRGGLIKIKHIKKAMKILSCDDGFHGVKNMIELIKKSKNQEGLIDYIDDVQICEKFEFKFDCKEFLEQIN